MLTWLAALFALCMATGHAAEQRVALVVGVSAYRSVPRLPNTVNDAKAIAAALTRVGFQVETLLDPDRPGFETAVRNFGQRARGADASLFFYAGHALELAGRNWLIPATAQLKTDRDLRFETLDLDAILEQTDGASRVSLVFLDSCRDNPFRLQLGAVTRDVPHGGLGQVRAATGTLVAFSTAPGTVAEDGKGPNSPFTTALLKWIETPGLDVRQMLSEVRREVRESTHGRQIPWENSALEGQFYFRPAAATTRDASTPARPDLEALFWDTVRGSRDPAEYRAYLTQFPNGNFAELARSRIAQLEQAARTGATAPASSPALRASLIARFAAAFPDMSAELREERAQQYDQGVSHKALAVFPPTAGTWRSQRWDSTEQAETAALEGCQVFFGAPCTLIASGEQLMPAPPTNAPWPLRDMPRARYAGSFDPEQIPMFTPELRRRDDIAGYAAAKGPKAASFHPWGRRMFVIRNAASQRAAEEEALAACNADPTRRGVDGPCFLYAVGDKVVLPQRSTQPLTSTMTDVPPETDALAHRITEALALVASKDNVAALYAKANGHKAIAVQAETGRTYRWSNLPTREVAEERVLELCQLRFGTPCVLLASDAELLAPNPKKAPKRDMPRLHYTGAYQPDQVPFHMEAAPELAGYAAMPEPKAMAIHSSPRVKVAGGASLAEAEAKALAACNDPDPAYPCFIYARNGQVVLPQRRTEAHR